MAKQKPDFGDKEFDFEVTTEIIDSGGEEHIPEIEGVSSETRNQVVATTNNQPIGYANYSQYLESFFSGTDMLSEGFEVGGKITLNDSFRMISLGNIVEDLQEKYKIGIKEEAELVFKITEKFIKNHFDTVTEDDEITQADVDFIKSYYEDIKIKFTQRYGGELLQDNNQSVGPEYLEYLKSDFFKSETLLEGYKIGIEITSEINNRIKYFILIFKKLSTTSITNKDEISMLNYILSKISYKKEEVTTEMIKLIEGSYINVREQIIEKTTN